MAVGRSRTEVQAGDLRKPITILVRSDVQDSTGGNVTSDAALFNNTVWAMDEHKRAHTRDEAGKLVTVTFHTYTVRYHPSIVAGLYIQDAQYARLMYIQGVVDPDGRRFWMELSVDDIEG